MPSSAKPKACRAVGSDLSQLIYDPSPAREGLRLPLPREKQRTVLVRITSPLGEAQIFLKIWVRGLTLKQSRSPNYRHELVFIPRETAGQIPMGVVYPHRPFGTLPP